MNLPKTYNSKEVEDEIYKKWEASGFFNPDNLEKAHDRFWNASPFSIAMPPPNITGILHLGHALENSLMDAEIRYQRMLGKRALLVPGTDHAAIATQNVVERKIWETEKKTRNDLGREELLKRIDEFVGQTRGRIQQQIRNMGTSADWSREKYTLSPELSLAVRTMFKLMYDAGLIYRGERIVNWCLRCGTTLADDEVKFQETLGQLYYIRYHFPKSKGGIVVATTRPETMLGDTAVAVNPKDERYKKYVGKTVMLPLINRELPIIPNEAVAMDFGTGALKITPGHDATDFEIGKKQGLEIINLFTPDGKINEVEAYDHGFEDYAGLSIAEGRDKIVEDLKAQGFLEKVEELKHNVGHCYRCGTIIESIISKQWFVNVNAKFEMKNDSLLGVILSGAKDLNDTLNVSFKEVATAAIKSGAIKIIPERFARIYLKWMENLKDWNISRQIWFGHRIPVWYCKNCGQTIVEINTPSRCPSCQSTELTQDEDTLDTWFSSSLWTFSTLGWPNQTEDLKNYHPTSWMQMGYEILFLWMTRMIFTSIFALGEVPFQEVYFHGMLRNKEGKKFSKSSKIGIDPVEIIDKYGTDALRLSLLAGISPGNDSRFYEEKVGHYKNFVNKLWNVSKFILANVHPEVQKQIPQTKTLADEWILTKLAELVKQITRHMDKNEFSPSIEKLYEFTWHEFADWYIEISKIRNSKLEIRNSEQILFYVLENLLRLWHPFIPFVTEHIWSQFSEELLMIQEYPLPASAKGGSKGDAQAIQRFQQLQRLITGLRNLRSEYHQPPSEIFSSYIELPKDLEWVKQQGPIIEKLARVKLNFEKLPANKKMPYAIWEGSKVYLIIPHFDPKKELALTEKEFEKTMVIAEALEKQLNKKEFLKKAPSEIVEKIKADFETTKLRIEKLKEKIKNLK